MSDGKAPFGRWKNGKPKAPYGYTKKGNVRKTPVAGKKTAAPAAKISGNGNYYIKKATRGWAPKVGAYLGGAAGGAIGGYIAPGIGTATGASVGSALGRRIGNRFKEITGYGDYHVNQNSVMFPSQATMIPSFGEDEIRVKKREIIGHIDMTTGYVTNVFRINASDPITFPWLSRIALNYQYYRFNGLVFEFKSTSSVAIASSTDLALGQVMMATNYDAVEGANGFVDDIQLLGSFFSNQGRSSENIMHAIECARKDQPTEWLYTRNSAPITTTDDRLYDMGVFNIATQGAQSAYENAGMLYVTYDVSLRASIQNNQLGLAINTARWGFANMLTGTPFLFSGMTAGSYLGITFENANRLVFPREMSSGYYLMVYRMTGTYAAGCSFDIGTTNNCEITQDLWPNLADPVVVIENSGSSSVGMCSFIIRLTGSNAWFEAALTANPSSGNASALMIITQVNGQIYL